jgi:hypothetical protein
VKLASLNDLLKQQFSPDFRRGDTFYSFDGGETWTRTERCTPDGQSEEYCMVVTHVDRESGTISVGKP